MEIKFKKVHTVKDLVISGAIVLAGAGLFFVNAGLGVVVAASGIISLLIFKTGYKREGDDLLLKYKAMDVDHSCRQSLKGFLDGKDVTPEVKAQGNGGIVRLEVYFNRSSGVAYAQLFDFSSYTYEKATEIVELHSPRAEKLINKL
ncbi:MAG: hypothetical protein SPL35_00640 [Bacteroidales bacterium]|nr:hypothetical protein [Bacteroidales bacterium]